MKAKKLSKIILSVALSITLLAEPVAGMSVVCAEEIQTTDRLTEGEKSDDIVTGNQQGSAENDVQDDLGDSDKKNDETEEPDKEDSDNSSKDEGDEGTDDSIKEESGDTTDPDDVSDEEKLGEENPDEERGDLDESEEGSTVSGNEIGEVSDEDGFSGMPSGYKLTSFQKELKSDLGNILGQISESDEGETYAEREVFTFAGSQEEAEMIAEAYNAEIIDFDMGVLTLKLSKGVTVKSALAKASNLRNNLPAVWPNYRRELYEEVVPETVENAIPGLEVKEEEYSIDSEESQQETEDGTPSLEAYEQALNELDAYNDPYLQPTDDKPYQWFHTTIGSIYAWDANYKGQTIKVGVIDSGVDFNTDLDKNVFGKKDFCDETPDAADYTGGKDSDGNQIKHGTHVAGIIAALQNDKLGVGVAPGAKIYNAKVFGNDATKSGYDSTIAKAILYLINENENVALKDLDEEVDHNKEPRVDIINMSLGGPGENPGMQLVLNKAYKKGVIVFAAAGNDGGSLAQYPASYDHVISVAATDVNNERASFSNYGSTVDLAAPGVNIWATYGSGYDKLQGTSMACPVAAGEAAVILSGKDALPSLKDKTGKARVDAVESIMKGNTISAGSGMGKGITSLTKVFKLSTAAAKPNTPTISFKDTSNDKEQSMDIIITAQAGMKICYTTNGKNPSYKNGELSADTKLENNNTVTVQVDGTNAAKGTVKAMAVNASGVISPVKSYTYTLKPYVTTITVSGPARVEKGKSIQLTAAVAPTYATNKKVEWKLQTAEDEDVDSAKISINPQNGKITTKAEADEGEYKVTVTAKDGSGITGTHTVEVVEANTAIQKIAFDTKKIKDELNNELWIKTNPAAATLSLAGYVTAEEKDPTGKKNQEIKDRVALAKRLVWTSSKPTIATVDSTGKVTAVAVGTTAITVKADDNLAKKATVNITVKQAVTGITITTDKGETADKYFTVAPGKSITLKAKLEPVKPTNNKINWSIAPSSDNYENDVNIKNNNITINKTNGKITTKPAAVPGSYVVTAEAADGKGTKATKNVTVVAGAIGEIKLDQTKVTLSTTNADGGTTQTTITATLSGVKAKDGSVGDFDPNAYMVTNNNEAVVTVKETASANGKVTLQLKSTEEMFGRANIVIASTDGSNKKATCAVTVSGGISKVELVDEPNSTRKVSKLTLFRTGTVATAPNTAKLYARISGSVGANVEAYKVESNNKLVVVESYDTKSGEIVLKASSAATGNATITVEATDGSRRKATCTVTVVNPASKITIAPKGGATRYVAWGKSLQLTAVVEAEYGVVANKAVSWSVPETVGGVPTKTILTVSASGRVTVPAKATGYGAIPVTATAKDGSGLTATYSVVIVPPTTQIIISRKESAGRVSRVYFISDCMASVSVSSSSPKVASPTISYSSASGIGWIEYVPNRQGTTTFTIKALDGTNKSGTYKIIVK